MYLAKLNKTHKGIRFRLTLVYSTLFGLFICIFAYILSAQFYQSVKTDFDSALLNHAIDLSIEVKQLDRSGFTSAIDLPPAEEKKHFPFILGQTFYIIRSLEGEILIQGPPGKVQTDIPYIKKNAFKEDYTHRFQYISVKEENDYRAINIKFSNKHGRGLILQVASPSAILITQQNKLILMNSITIPLLILISSIASYILAGKALGPVKNLTENVNLIAASNLSQRVPVPDSGDEIEELSRTFNHLLERLEKSFKAQESFVANASHQLNTPLSIIKGELDVLESKPRTPEEILRFQGSLREELDRLIILVKDMLLISRVESGQGNIVYNSIRLDEILMNVSSRLNLMAREKKITQKINISEELIDSEEVLVSGEKQLLECLFENLIENAIKYSPEGGVVRIDIKAPTGKLEVWIQDEGPGIDPTNYENIIFERFYRGAKMILPGTGIGLALAHQVAKYHSAQILYEKIHPVGSLFIVRFA